MAWSRVQSASGAFFGTSVSATFSVSNVVSGNKIIVYVASNWQDAPSSVQDGLANNWTLLGSQVRTGGGSVWLYGLDVPAADAGTKPTITVTFPSSNGQSVIIQEVSGLLTGNTTAMIDGTAAGLSGTTASTGSPSYSTTAANEYLVCLYGDKSGAITPAALGGWTTDPQNVPTGNTDESIEYKNSTGGSETSGWTNATTNGWSVLTVAFKLPASAGVAGSVQPEATVPVPRRRPARAVWAQITGQAFVAVPAPKQEYQLAPRRRPARAVWKGGAGQAFVFVPAPVQQYRLAPRRVPARAYVRFTPVVTTNAAAVQGPAGTVPVLMTNQTRVVVRRDGRVVRQ